MMHICFINSLYSRYDQIIFSRQATSLVGYGFKVTILVCDNLPNEFINGINIISCGWSPNNRKSRFLNSRRILYRKFKNVRSNIVQISEPELIPLGLKLKKEGYKVVFNMREGYVRNVLLKEYLPVYARKLISIALECYFKYSLCKFDGVVVVTDSLRKIVCDWGVVNVVVVTNYPIIKQNDCANFSFKEYRARKDILVYFGTVYSISYQENIFDAVSKVPNLEYSIHGVIDDKSIKEHPYWENICFSGRFSQSNLKEILSGVTINNTLRDFKRTSSKEGSLGVLKIFDGMKNGLPTIFSDCKIYRELVKKYNCGICVDINNVEEIKKTLDYFVINKEEAYKMGQNGIKAVLKEYNWSTQEEKYCSVYKKLL